MARNDRGNARDRLARRLFLLTRDGDGTTAPCWECGTPVNIATLVVDRITPGVLGGRYVRGNIRCHCRPCSDRQGYNLGIGAHRALATV
jgi:hypothetical protein